MKINRRNFIKGAGMLLVAPTAFLRAAKTKANSLSVAVIKRTKQKCLTVKDKAYYVVFLHPKQLYQLRVLAARDKYKHARHIERYNRWAKSQGKPPYVESVGELGTFEGVRFKAG